VLSDLSLSCCLKKFEIDCFDEGGVSNRIGTIDRVQFIHPPALRCGVRGISRRLTRGCCFAFRTLITTLRSSP
jgi:hypothetical protein